MFRLLKIIFSPLFRVLRQKPAPMPQKGAPQSNRVHIFHGTFATELNATRYCLDAPSRNEPEPLARDLPDATIDTAEVEIIFGQDRIAVAVPMFATNPQALLDQIGTDNTIIMIAEAAFMGLPYALNDTPALRYAGAFDVT